MSDFTIHEKRWTKAYNMGDEKSLNLHLRKQYIVEEILKLEILKDSTILDIGCGTGEIPFELESKGFVNIVAQDISQKFIDIAKEKQRDDFEMSQIKFSIGGVCNLHFKNETFQLVIASGLIEWVRYDRWALQEIQRVLRPGGYLIVTVPNKLRLSNILTPRRLWGIWKTRNHPRVQEPFTRHWYSQRGLIELLAIAGYKIKKNRTNGFAQLPHVRWNSKLSFQTFKWFQYIADRNHDGWIGRTGSNIISIAQKPLQNDDYKSTKVKELSQYCLEYERRYQHEFKRLKEWKNNNILFTNNEILSNSIINDMNIVISIAPHPDDELIGCGGLLMSKKDQGARVGIIYLTDGRSSSGWKNASSEILNTERYQEARNVCHSLKFDKVSYLDGVSGQLQTTSSLVNSVREFIDEFKPNGILVPFINDPHSDHIESNKILYSALNRSQIALDEIIILNYEVWSFVPANIYYNIDEYSNKKSNELMKYKTAMQVVNYKRDCVDRSLYHGIRRNSYISQVESFYCISGITYLDLVNKHYPNI